MLVILAVSAPAVGQVDESGSAGFRIVSRTEDYNHKWALIVGVDYERRGEEWRLRNPERDAAEVCRELEENKGFECQLVLGEDASRAGILSALAKLQRRVGEDDCFLFYFAGHGDVDESCPVLYPSDFEVDGAFVNRIRADEIVSERLKARHALYVFDSCYSGRIVDIPYKNLKRRQGEPTFEGRSIQILTAATDNQKAKDGDSEHSPFATAFLSAFEFEEKISASEIHRKISERLRGQKSILESFVPGRDAVAAGEFYFTGTPRLGRSRVVTYQTLGGSHGTLAASPLSRTWFEETPWLTPALRLILDDDTLGVPRLFPSVGATDPVDHQPTSTRELVERAQNWLESKPTIDSSVLDTYSSLKRLPDAQDKSAVIASALKAITSRSVDVSPTDLHTMALLKCAALRYRDGAVSGGATSEIDDLFAKAVAAYEDDQRSGLVVRCLADRAAWHLELRDYALANRTYRQALSHLDEIAPAEGVRVELLAGAADSSRRLAKNLLASGKAASEDDRLLAQQLWQDAHSYYRDLEGVLDRSESAESRLNRAYLHERLAWLNMDHWNVAEAKQHFERAVALREETEMGLVSFLCYANSRQGIAMIDQMTGSSGKEDLAEIQDLVEGRLRVSAGPPENASVLYGRLCNTIERLGDCDFGAGRDQLLSSIGSYRAGLDACDQWLPLAKAISEREANRVRIQRLRFLCKTAIAAAADNRRDLCSEVAPELERERGKVDVNSGVLLVLCDFAEAFVEYCESRKTCEGGSGCQNAIDAIRAVIHRHSAASMDRETAELLLVASSIVAREQQRQDAIVLRKLLPADANGDPPSQMTRNVRQQYDRVVMLQGRSYSGQVEWREFQAFRDLILSVQGDSWSRAERDGPHVLFYFPIDGSQGLVVMSNGLRDGADEVYEVGFGWKDVGELNPRLHSKLARLLRDHSDITVGWANDRMLRDAGFSAGQCPFLE
ncbi:caspase family protein [Maioricimonas sp. JC845]|uniref:caspase family protein n=1 Tax=Maioricimonas sp. JC845 TaxID=3232138 RepID=UPI00345AD96F